MRSTSNSWIELLPEVGGRQDCLRSVLTPNLFGLHNFDRVAGPWIS